jgi:hypothetical protein
MSARLSEAIKKQVYLHSKTILALSIIAALGIISITWFQGSFLINGLDRSFPPDRTAYFTRGFYVWDIFQLGGLSVRTLAGLFPANLFLYATEIAGLSLVTAEQLWFYLLFVSAGFSMYFLSTTVYNGKYRQLVGLVSALFFMFNPYTIISVVPQMWLYIIFLPLILGLFIKGLQEKRGIKYIFGFSLIWSFTITSDYTNPKFLLFDLLPLFLYLILYIMLHRSKVVVKSSLRFTGLLSAIWIGLNSFWLIPTISSLGDIIASPLGAYAAIGTSRLSNYVLSSAPLSGAYRLLGFWSLNANYEGFPYAYWAPAYNTALFVAIGFLIPILAFAFLLRRPTKLKKFFFVILAIIGLFMMSGSMPPLGWINTFLATHIPMWVDVFSNPYMFGGMYVAIAFAFLLASFIPDLLDSKLIEKIFKFKKDLHLKYLLTGLILFLIIGLYAFPLWDGEVIYPGNALMASNRYQIPSYYNDAKTWLSADGSDFRIFALPYSIIGYGAYNWLPEGFNGPDPTEILLGRSLIAGLTGQGLGLEAAQGFVNGSGAGVAKLLALMNVKYVVVHNDAAWSYVIGNNWYVSPTPNQIKTTLNNQTDFTFEKSFGQLDFYLNTLWTPMRVYAVTNNILLDGSQAQIARTAESTDFEINESILALSSQLNADQVSNLPTDTVFIQTPDLNMSYNPVSGVENGQRFVYLLNSKVVAEARYYSGWKGIISTDGTGDGNMLVYSSPLACPYLPYFPAGFVNWSSYDSTLIYVASSSQLTINSVTADGVSVDGQAWWRTGTSWTSGWPITIPPNEDVTIQVAGKAKSISLQTDNGSITIPAADGQKDPLTILDPSQTRISTPNSADYILAIYKNAFGNGNFTVKIDDHTFNVNLNQNQSSDTNFSYIGPVYLAGGIHTISMSRNNMTISQMDGILIYSLDKGESFLGADKLLSSTRPNNSSITYQRINPTQYNVNVNSSNVFYLVFSEAYDKGWVASIDGHQIPAQQHFTANGFANCWYINKTGSYTIKLEFIPQNLFYVGAFVSLATLIVCSIYVGIKNVAGITWKFNKKCKSE